MPERKKETEESIPEDIHVYLAGPDVFLPDPIGRGQKMKQTLATHGIQGHFPFDNELPPGENKDPRELAFAIAKANEDMMSKCTVILANLTPWYGPNADNGTSFEMGFMSARDDTLIIGYYSEGFPKKPKASERVTEMVYNGKVTTNSAGFLVSTETDRSIENFGLADNLMLIGAIHKTGGKIYGSFEDAAADIKNVLAEKQQKQNAQKESVKSPSDLRPSLQDQPVPKKDENMLWGYHLTKASVVGAATAVVGAAVAVGFYAGRQSKYF